MTAEIPIEQLAVGDVVVVRPHTRIAADGFVITGFSSVDEASVTGESMPVDKRAVDDPAAAAAAPEQLPASARVYAGTINGAAGAATLQTQLTTLFSSATAFQSRSVRTTDATVNGATIEGSAITASDTDGTLLEGLAGAAGSSLNFSYQGNAIKTTGNFATGVSIDWNGVLLANGIGNGFHMTGNDSIGYSITTHGPALAQISLGNNVMYMDGDDNIVNGTILMRKGENPSLVLEGVK